MTEQPVREYIRSDTGNIYLSTKDEERRGYHKYERFIEFYPDVTMQEAEALVAGFKLGSNNMWFNAKWTMADGKIHVRFSYGYDSGD